MIQAINPSIHPPNQTPTHGGGGLHRFQIFKHYQIISIHSSLIEFLLIMRSPPMGLDGWVVGGEGGWGQPPHTCTHIHPCMHVHTCVHTHTHTHMLNMINMAATMVVAIYNFLTC